MFLIKSAIQYNNSKTDDVVALYGAHLHVIMPRQHSYLRRCWSGGKPFATLCKIWPAWYSNSRPQAITVNTVVQWCCKHSAIARTFNACLMNVYDIVCLDSPDLSLSAYSCAIW